MNKRIEGREEQEKMLKAQKQSGLSVKAFCLREKICKSSLYDWRKRLSNFSSQGFMQVMSDDVSRKPLVPGYDAKRNYLTGVRIALLNGYTVEVNGCDEDILLSILEVVKRV